MRLPAQTATRARSIREGTQCDTAATALQSHSGQFCLANALGQGRTG